MSPTEDAALVRMALNGDHSAFGALVDRYKNLVYGLLLNRIGDFDQAEDLAQDAFIEAYVHLEKLREPVRFSSWLCGIATNLSSKLLSRQERESEVMGQMAAFQEDAGSVIRFSGGTEPATPEQEVAAQELKEAIWQAVGELPERSREVILLFYFNDMSHTRIAQFLGVAPNTVLSQLRHGRNRLRDKMLPFVEETLREKALGRSFTEKALAALPLISFAQPVPLRPQPGLPLAKWGLSLKGALVGFGILALIGGAVSWVVFSARGGRPRSSVYPEANSRRLRVRLATPEETAALRELRDQRKETEMTASEQGRVIDGVPSLAWGRKECTFAGALEAALAATGHACAYSEIMGLTGLACRVRWFQGHTGQRWCASSPVGEFPEEIAAIQRASGWQFRIENLLGQEDPRMERFAPDIVASLDAGRPVLAYGEALNMAVVYGHEEGGKTLLLRDYSKGDAPFAVPASKLGPFLIFLRDRAEPLPARDGLREALGIAARNWRREPVVVEKGQYWYGDSALSKWAEDLSQVDPLTQDQKENLFFVSSWNFKSLFDARQAAVSFLEDGATILEGDGRTALERAARLYEQEVEFLRPLLENTEVFFCLGGKPLKDWSGDVRQREVEILSQCREKERRAIAGIQSALAAGF